MHRPLSPVEQMTWLIDQSTQQNFIMVSRLSSVSGNFSNFEKILRQALDILQEKFPPLKCKIVGINPPEFVSEEIPSIPLRVFERKSEKHWIEIVEKEMIEPLPWSVGPLVRVTLLISKNQDKCDLLSTFCHVIGDATSGVVFVKNLLTIADKLLREGKIDFEPPRPPLPSMENLLRKDIEFEPESNFTDETYPTAQLQSAELQGNKDFPPDKRITRVIQRILLPEEVKQLSIRCKDENTTIHGVVCAALMQALVEEIKASEGAYKHKDGPLSIGCVTPINVRHHFSQPADEDIGFFITQAIHYQLIDDKASIWEAARKVRESFQKEVRMGNDIKAYLTIGEVLKSFLSHVHLARELHNASAPLVVTNMGRLNIPGQFGELFLEELFFTVAINADAKNGLGISITTFRGRMTLNFLYSDPYISKKGANKLVQNTVKRLKKALT